MKFEERSWYKHLPPEDLDICEENLHEFFQMVFERHEIWYKRNLLRLEAPWTENEILRDYKFTNVYRELDRSSQWLIKNIILNDSIDNLEDLIFKMMIYKFYNKPETFTHAVHSIELPNWKEFNENHLWRQTVDYRKHVDDPWHGAYLMNPTNLTKRKAKWVDGEKPGIFRDWVYTHIVFKKVHKVVPTLAKQFTRKEPPAQYLIDVLKEIPAVSDFMATEFFLDFTYIPRYSSKFTFPLTENDHVNVGPGCSTGIRLIFPSLKKKDQEDGIQMLFDICKSEFDKIGDFKYTHWNKSNQEYFVDKNHFNITKCTIEFQLCEYQKYWKMRIGEGKQRSKFVPKTIF